MSESGKKKPMVYEKPRLINLGSNDVVEGQYCTPGTDWPSDCVDGPTWTGCVDGPTWTGCVDGPAWAACVDGPAWSEDLCQDGFGAIFECFFGDHVGGQPGD